MLYDSILEHSWLVSWCQYRGCRSSKRNSMLEAIACQDGVCGDGLSIATSFIPGPNVTTVVTVPISMGCKVFVYCCKRAKSIPWGC